MIGTVNRNDTETVSLELVLNSVEFREVQAMSKERE